MNRVIIFLLYYVLFHCAAMAQTPTTDPHWQLKWEDQFNTFDHSKWLKAHYATHGEGEPQLYLQNNVWVANGFLVIALNNSSAICPTPAPDPISSACVGCVSRKRYEYTSGWVETTPMNSTQYGYIEARIKLPYRASTSTMKWGFWPAFWTYIGDGTNPTNHAEIDIFEIYGSNPNNLVETNAHTCYADDNPNCIEHYLVKHLLPNFTYTEWHTYAIEWNQNKIIWYIDGVAIRALYNHGIIDPVRIILNMAVQKNSRYHPPKDNPFTEYMYVDYVRVYDLKCSKNTVVNEINNLTTYNYGIKKSITLSKATVIPAGSNIHLRATDFIELKTGFEVGSNSQLYLDITPCDNKFQ